MTKIKSSKKFVALFILAVFTLTAFLLVGCGDDKSVNINTSSKNYQTMETSVFATAFDSYQNAGTLNFTKYEFELEVNGTMQTGPETTQTINSKAYGQMDMVNQVMSMEIESNGEKCYSYISDGYLYVNQDGVKTKILMEQAGGQMAIAILTMENIVELIDSALEEVTYSDFMTIECESAVDGDFTKYHVSISETATQSQTEIYIILQGENLYGAQYTIENNDYTQTATLKVYDGEIDLPSFDDYVEPTTNLF